MIKYEVAYKSNSNSVYSCKYHVVWCPKYRRPVLINGIDIEFASIVRVVCAENRSDLLEMEVMPDHVHLLVEVDPVVGVHKLIKRIKGRSSRILRSKHRSLRSRIPALWTNSYFVSTVGGAPLDVVKQYIEGQKGV